MKELTLEEAKEALECLAWYGRCVTCNDFKERFVKKYMEHKAPDDDMPFAEFMANEIYKKYKECGPVQVIQDYISCEQTKTAFVYAIHTTTV